MRSGDRGFSLIEVLIALVLFSLAVTMLSNAYFNSIQSISHNPASLEQFNYDFVKRQVLMIASREEVETGGQITLADDKKVQWDAMIEDTTIIDLFQLTLTIRTEQFSEEVPYEETVYVLRPQWSNPEDREKLLTEKKIELDTMRPLR